MSLSLNISTSSSASKKTNGKQVGLQIFIHHTFLLTNSTYINLASEIIIWIKEKEIRS